MSFRYRQAEVMPISADAASGSNVGYLGVIRRDVTAGAGGAAASQDRGTITPEHSLRMIDFTLFVTTAAVTAADTFRLTDTVGIVGGVDAGALAWGATGTEPIDVAGTIRLNSTSIANTTRAAAAGIFQRATDTDGAWTLLLYIKPE